MTMDKLQIAQTRMFGETPLDIYQNESGELYMTRNQIGTALEYAEPRKAIMKIHERNPDRIAPLSLVVNLVTKVGNHTQQRQTYVYNLRGVMEICRLSRQPKADAFMDFTWDVMESLHKGKTVLASPNQQAAIAPQVIQQTLAQLLQNTQIISQRLNTLDEKVSTINPPQSLPAPPQYAATTDKDISSAVPWREKMYTMIRKICELRGRSSYTVRACLNEIYTDMRQSKSFKEERQREIYRRRHPDCGKYISTIDVIEDSETFSAIFEALIKERLEEEQEKAKNANLLKERIKQLTAASEQMHRNKNESTPAALPPAAEKEKEAAPPPAQAVPRHITGENISACVAMLAKATQDTSQNYSRTWRRLYSNMNVKNWATIETCYRKRRRKCTAKGKINRKKLVLDSPTLLYRFKKSWAELYEQAQPTQKC